MGWFRAGLLTAACILACISCGRRPAPTDYGRETEAFLARKLVWARGERVFAAFDLFGVKTEGTRTIAYGWVLRYGFIQRTDQVIHEDAASFPLAVYFRRAGKGMAPTGYRRPELGSGMARSVAELFPPEYRRRALGGTPPGLLPSLRSRVLDHYEGRMPAGRFLRRPPPAVFSNAHRHQDDIYGLLNIKSPYKYLRIVRVPRPADERVIEGPVTSPDRRFTAWSVLGERRRLYIRDAADGAVYEVRNGVNDWQSGLAWKPDNILVFDQLNGINTFGDGRNHGVHLEIDAVRREVVWAVPFGPLGFPKTS